jgi:hypothetical protein
MRIAIFLILLLLAPLALAGERVVRQGADEVRVFDSPCVSAETIGRIPEKDREGWNKVQGRFNGQRYFGCWRPLGDSAIHILWDDGDQGVIPLIELKPVLDI